MGFYTKFTLTLLHTWINRPNSAFRLLTFRAVIGANVSTLFAIFFHFESVAFTFLNRVFVPLFIY